MATYSYLGRLLTPRGMLGVVLKGAAIRQVALYANFESRDPGAGPEVGRQRPGATLARQKGAD